MAKRKKVFNINELSNEELATLSLMVGDQVRTICDKAVKRANRILNKYDMECKMAFQIRKLGTFEEKQPTNQKKDNLTSNT